MAGRDYDALGELCFSGIEEREREKKREKKKKREGKGGKDGRRVED